MSCTYAPVIIIGDEDVHSIVGSAIFIQTLKRRTISAYSERTNIFFEANKIEEDKQRVTLFFNAIGAKIYSLLRDLLSPAALMTRTF